MLCKEQNGYNDHRHDNKYFENIRRIYNTEEYKLHKGEVVRKAFDIYVERYERFHKLDLETAEKNILDLLTRAGLNDKYFNIIGANIQEI